MTIEQFDCSTRSADIVAALDRDGAVLVTGLCEPAAAAAVGDPLRGPCEKQSPSTPFTTLPEHELFAASPGAMELIGQAQVLSVADAVLLRNASSCQLGTANAILIRPGADEQALQADVCVYPLRIPGIEWHINALWALDDVGADSGAPTLIPGSHSWHTMPFPDEKDKVHVAMPQGSVLFSMGWTLRGWGRNRSNKASLFLLSRYSLGWLRAEVNHVLTLSGESAANYPEAIRRLLGYASYENGRLGWYP
jgi:ectoine hydroxylase-related dioxygenase (phytanoyl-CoA dioxygenase family)